MPGFVGWLRHRIQTGYKDEGLVWVSIWLFKDCRNIHAMVDVEPVD